MTNTRMGRVQLKIMQVLWERGRANAREITDALCQDQPIAHSTVQTLLRKLEEKGAVAHDLEDRTFIFYALVKKDNVRRTATRELLERMFGGSATGLVAYVLSEEPISRAELDEIRKLIASKTSRRGSRS